MGHRLYSDSDFQKLQKIMTLKFVGFSLADIRKVMTSPETSMRDTLSIQKQILYEKNSILPWLIDAIDESSKMLEER